MFSVARNEKLKFKARPKKAQISSLLFPECFKICPCTFPDYVKWPIWPCNNVFQPDLLPEHCPWHAIIICSAFTGTRKPSISIVFILQAIVKYLLISLIGLFSVSIQGRRKVWTSGGWNRVNWSSKIWNPRLLQACYCETLIAIGPVIKIWFYHFRFWSENL